MDQDWWIVTQDVGRVLQGHIPITCTECGWKLGSVITTYDGSPVSSRDTEKVYCDKCGTVREKR